MEAFSSVVTFFIFVLFFFFGVVLSLHPDGSLGFMLSLKLTILGKKS